jgi:RNA polymerase sigma-70 factor (ECF subfamily)
MNTHRSITVARGGSDFGRTRWSMVIAVREGSESEARRSLGELCRRYWVPVYAYMRRSGYEPENAVLLVQRFLSHLVAKLKVGQPRVAGVFRSYLLGQLEEFLASQERRNAAVDTGAEMDPPWPLEEIERRQLAEHPTGATPAEALQRGFALELLAIALYRLRQEAAQSEREALFEAVRPYLSREPNRSEYAALAAAMKSSTLAMVVAVKRLRQRFQELVDEELAQTVGDAQSLQNERQTLLSLAGPPRQ